MKKETWVIRFLYGTVTGRFLLKILVCPSFSKNVGKFLDSRLSGWMVPLFVKGNRIDMRQYEKKTYRSFNDFFTRKRCVERIDLSPEYLISPCDGYLSVYPVRENQTYRIKHVEYDLGELLKDETLAEQFSGGLCMIFRLTPRDYHRYCYICSGSLEEAKSIPGKLHCVRPIACTSVPVFVENSREYTRLHSPRLGTVIQMEIGALLVGKIRNDPYQGYVLQGMEKGCFAFGGSTVMVLVQKGKVHIEPHILQNTEQGIETKVEKGEKICTIQKLIGEKQVENIFCL